MAEMRIFSIVFSFIMVVDAAFDFNDLEKIKKISFDTVKEFNCGCMYIIKPEDVNVRGSEFLDRFGRNLAKGMRESGRQRHIQIGVYDYVKFHKFYQRNTMDLKTTGTCFKAAFFIVGNNNSSNVQLQEVSRQNMFSSSMWLVFMNTTPADYFDNVNLRFDSRIYSVTSLENSNGVQYSEVYRVRSRYPVRINRIAIWTEDTGFIRVNGSRNIRRSNLEGLLLRAVTLHIPLTSMMTVTETSNRSEISGYIPDIWKEMEDILNFTSTFKRSVKDVVGYPDGDGQWTGQIGLIQRGEVDVLLFPLDFSPWRLDIVNYLLPILTSRFQIFFRAIEVPDWWFVFRPFSRRVWLALLSWILLGAVMVCYGSNVAVKCGLEGAYPTTFANSFFFVLQTICTQGSNYIPRVGAVRFMIVLCYLVSTIILAAYSGSLISSLTSRVPLKQYDKFEDLLNAGTPVLLPGTNHSGYEYFTSVKSGIVRDVYKKLVEPYMVEREPSEKGLNAFVHMLCDTEGLAAFSDEADFVGRSAKARVPCAFDKFSRPVAKIYQSLAFSKNSTYTEIMNFTILRLAERGILKRIGAFYNSFKKSSGPSPMITLSIYDVFEVFFFLLSAMVLSVFILLFECVWNNRRSKTAP